MIDYCVTKCAKLCTWRKKKYRNKPKLIFILFPVIVSMLIFLVLDSKNYIPETPNIDFLLFSLFIILIFIFIQNNVIFPDSI